MDRERFLRVKALFQRALPLGADARVALLDSECGADPALAAEVSELLAHAAAAGPDFLDGGTHGATAALPPAIEIAGFRVLEALATGGSGVVYRAEQLTPRREVALKVLRVDALAPGAAARFARESEILGSLRHPGIAQVFGAGIGRHGSIELPWIAMELVHGRPLDEFVADVEREPRAVLELFVAICAAVDHAHQRGIVHRDLKPSNVLVEADGRPRVLDFGVARVLGEDAGSALTRTGSLVGTLAYMAPEQTRGTRGTIDARADVYALGVVLFEMLTGRLPIDVDGADVLESVRAVCEVEPEGLSSARPGLPRDLGAVVARALDKESARRYPNAGALARDVSNVLANRPVEARHSTVIDQARRFVRRNRALTYSAAAVILALAIGLGIALTALERTRAERARTGETLDFVAERMAAIAPRLGFGEEQRGHLEDVVARIESQLAVDPTSRSLRAALAQMLYELASLDQARGDQAALRSRAEQALRLREALSREDPGDIESLTRASDLCAKLGEAARDSGDLVGRNAWFARALAIDEELVRQHPDDSDLVEDLGWSLARVLHVTAERGDTEAAERLAVRRVDDAARIAALDESDWKLVYNLSNARSVLSGLLLRRGEVRKAVPEAEAALRLARRLRELEPSRRDFVAWHAHACRAAARVLVAAKRAPEALQVAIEALESAEALAAADPLRPAHVELVVAAARELSHLDAAPPRSEARRALETLERVARSARRAGATPAAAALREAAETIHRDLGPG